VLFTLLCEYKESNKEKRKQAIINFALCEQRKLQRKSQTRSEATPLCRKAMTKNSDSWQLRASDKLRHLTFFSVVAPNASSAIVCSLRSVIAAHYWRYT